MTKQEALAELFQLDHAIINEEWAVALAKPFGFTPHLITYRDCRKKDGTTNNPKGVFLNSGPGTSMKGLGADDLACQIARHLGVEYESKFGRGSQLREACYKIQKHLTEEKEKSVRGMDRMVVAHSRPKTKRVEWTVEETDKP